MKTLFVLINPETYWDDINTCWEDTFSGMREIVLDPDAPLGLIWQNTARP
jgi:hypothetical protein